MNSATGCNGAYDRSSSAVVDSNATFGNNSASHCVAFISQASLLTVSSSYGLTKRLVPVRHCRNIGKKDMKLNSSLPTVEVDPETYEVVVDGVTTVIEPTNIVPMARGVYFF